MSDTGGTNLRPLGIGEILDAALKVYRVHFKTLSLAVLIPIFAVSALQALLFASVDTDELVNSDDGSFSAPDGFWGAFIASVLLFYVAVAIAFAASFHAVIRGYLADGTTWQESLKAGLRRLVPLILLIIVAAILAGVLFFVQALVIAIFWPLGLVFFAFNVWLWVRLSVSAPAVLAERAGPLKALARSFELVKGRWWPVFGAMLAMIVLIIVFFILAYLFVGVIFADPDSFILSVIVSTVVTTLQYTIVLPVVAAVSTILYYDLRVRKEGYDLQLAAGGLTQAPVAVTAGATTGGFTAPSEGGFAPPSGSAFSGPPEPATADQSADTSQSQPPPGFGGGGGLAIPTPAPAPPPEPDSAPASTGSGFGEPAPPPDPAPEPEPPAPEPEPEPPAPEPEPEPAAPEPASPTGGFGVPTPVAEPDPAPASGGFGERTETPAPHPEPAPPEPPAEPGFSWSPTPAEEDEAPAPPPPGEDPPPSSQ